MKKEIITGITCGVSSVLLASLIIDENLPYDPSTSQALGAFLGIFLSVVVGILFIRSSISQFHQRLSVSVGIASIIAVWILTSSIVLSIAILFPAICVALFVWVNSATINNE